MKALRLLILFFVAALSCQIAGAYSGIDFFGDSLMDVGNVWTATSHAKPLCPEYWNGRFCNGPNYADALSIYLGLPAPTPSVLGGNDYAWGGAGTATSGVSTLATPNLGTQVSMFLADLNGSQVDPDRLIVVWAGGNDPIYENQMNYALSAANIGDAVTRLATQAGAKHILVNNLPLLGYTPTARKLGPDVQAALNGWTTGFDDALAGELASLQTTLGPSGVTIMDTIPGEPDIRKKYNYIIADPSAYQVTNVTDQAYLTDDSSVPGILTPNSEHYLFWDFVHPTSYAAHLLVPEPSTLVLLSFSVISVCIAAVRIRRRAK